MNTEIMQWDLRLISVHVGMNISGANRTHLALTFIHMSCHSNRSVICTIDVHSNVNRYRIITNYCPIAVGVENPQTFWMCRQPPNVRQTSRH
jgi:hypothetical protein